MLDEVFAFLGVAVVGEFAVDDRPARGAFGGVGGRLDSFDGGERPRCGPDLQWLVGEDAVEVGAFALACGALEQRAELALDGVDLARERSAVAVGFEGAPGQEQPSG